MNEGNQPVDAMLLRDHELVVVDKLARAVYLIKSDVNFGLVIESLRYATEADLNFDMLRKALEDGMTAKRDLIMRDITEALPVDPEDERAVCVNSNGCTKRSRNTYSPPHRRQMMSKSPHTDPAVIVPRLRELSHAVTLGEQGRHEFTMRVPAEPNRDADIVLFAAADEIESLRSRIAEREWEYVKDGAPTDDSVLYDFAMYTERGWNVRHGWELASILVVIGLHDNHDHLAYRIYRNDPPPPLPETEG